MAPTDMAPTEMAPTGLSRFRRAVRRVMNNIELEVLPPFSGEEGDEDERDDMLGQSSSKQGCEGEDEDEEGNLDAEMRKFDIEMKKLMLTQEKESLDLSTINCQRRRGENISSLKIGAEENVRLIKLASLEGSQKYSSNDIYRETSVSSTDALLNYFALLGESGNEDEIDLNFIEVLCIHGDINVRDTNGQTIMHEVARDWDPGVAYFLKLRGADIDAADNWGRTPLFVAVASSHLDMINWLVQNGADINHKTIAGEGQRPIHFAARYDAIDSFELLMSLGANPIERDDYERTPFFLAAEAGLAKICCYLLDLELPTASFSTSGVATIDYIVANLPTPLAWRALDQFISISPTNDNIKIYLNCLTKRRWQILKRVNDSILYSFVPPAPLEIITRREELSLINHPVIVEMIKEKACHFGDKWNRIDLFFHFLFTALWTLCVSFRVSELGNEEIIDGDTTHLIVLILSFISQMLTSAFVYKLHREWKAYKYIDRHERIRITEEVRYLEQYCHPRWVNDETNLNKKRSAVTNTDRNFWSSDWVMMEVTCLVLATIFFIMNIAWYICEQLKVGQGIRDVRQLYSAAFVIIVWMRLNRALRSSQLMGPYVAMIQQCFVAGTQILFLFVEFYIPFCVAFWVLFGGDTKEARDTEYGQLNDLMYQLWLLAFIGDYEYAALAESHSPLAAEILLGLYLVLISIITINIYIALLSEAVARVNETAVERAYMAGEIDAQKIEMVLPEYKRQFEKYINDECAPKIMDKYEYLNEYSGGDERTALSSLSTDITALATKMRHIAEGENVMTEDISLLKENLNNMKQICDEKQIRSTLSRLGTLFQIINTPLVKLASNTERRVVSMVDRINPMDKGEQGTDDFQYPGS